MQTPSLFKVYNASAGSGKTFTLVKEYLKIVLNTTDVFTFQKILAITFTNKAANEMKERVLNNLHAFADGNFNDMAQKICQEIAIDKTILQKRASNILREIINNYSAFAITTIDSFTYKIIRSFAFDLGLSLNFDVELNSQNILEETVNNLISKMGKDDNLTKTLLRFALFKWQKDETWDVTFALNTVAKLLVKEDAVSELEKLKDKTLDDYLNLHKKLKKQITLFDTDIHKLATQGQQIITEINVSKKAYAGGGDYPSFITKLLDKNYDINFEGRLAKSIAKNSWNSAKATFEECSAIESRLEALEKIYFEIKYYFDTQHKNYILAQLAIKNIIPLSVLSQLNRGLTDYKLDNNIRLNSEFNTLIRKHIKEEPVPFIYEKLGEKYSHFFIDEMQDTSVFQWENLIPLISNALHQPNGSLFLVGDAKQAIYRWRGGKAQQFIDLTLDENPFFIEKKVETLPTNFRSFSQIIHFNNDFFESASKYLSNPTYQALYKDNSAQKTTDKIGGYVQIDFLEKGLSGEDKTNAYAENILNILQNLDTSYPFGDVCILVRKKGDGAKIASILSAHGYDIMTSESLLLINSVKVNFILNFLNYLADNSNKKALADVLIFLHQYLEIKIAIHDFISSFLNLSSIEVFKKFTSLNINFSDKLFNEQSLYQSVAYLIRSFKLIKNSDAFIQFFLEEVLNFEQKQQGALTSFLEHFENNKENFSVVSSKNEHAITILTIHKAKGLEFPIVIFPNNVTIHYEKDPTEWYKPKEPVAFNNFDTLLINGGPKLEKTDAVGQALYKKTKEALELDNLNLLYVGLTRAVEQLYLVTEQPPTRNSKSITYSLMYEDYLKEQGYWQAGQNSYSFGSKERPKHPSLEEKETQTNILKVRHISTDWQSHNIHIVPSASKYWNKEMKDAAEFGTLLHDILAQILTADDINTVLDSYFKMGKISALDVANFRKLILQIVNHLELKNYYAVNTTVYNECEIVTANKELIRLDRLILKDKTAVIIDYKTGTPNTKHEVQLNNYAEAISAMSYTVIHKILVYLRDPVQVVFV
ncbi:MAG: UvrD-helicase domain-containing protein [Flavobacteriaceae bacterium]